MPVKTISILGCGWLGLPLAKFLITQGYHVKGSTTTPAKLAILQKNNIESFLLKSEPRLSGSAVSGFFQSDILVVTIPFRRDFKDPRLYAEQIGSIVRAVENSSIDFTIFTSSTSVYPDSLKMAAEDSEFVADNPRSEVLLRTEKLLSENKNFDTTVVRFGGLFGADRKIGRFLSGKDNLKGGNNPVNLIHLDDCVQIISEIIRQDIRREVFNACCDEHPSRKALYSACASRLGIAPPVFDEAGQESGKIVSNEKIKRFLNYSFRYAEPCLNEIE